MSGNRLFVPSAVPATTVESPAAALSTGAFVLYPHQCLPAAASVPMLQRLYQLAFEQAQAVMRPSRWEFCYRDWPN
jgi:hypothetical protein